MKRSVDFRVLLAAVLFGFLGGAASSLVLPHLAFAQGDVLEHVTTGHLRIVDKEGRTLASIGGSPDQGTGVILRPGQDPEEMTLPMHGSIELFDSDGHVYWSMPQPLVRPLAAGAGGE